MSYYLRGKLIPKGERGYSAYEIAVQHGFIGTEEEWLASLEAGESASIVQEIASTSSNETIPSTLAVYNHVNGIETTLQGQVDDLSDAVSAILSAVYPVGSIYMSTTNTNPGTLFGGTWVAWGAGRVPVGVDTGDTSFDTAEETGGSKTISLEVANLPSHNHTYDKPNSSTGSTTLTINQIPSHRHYFDEDLAGVWKQKTGYGQVTATATTGANRANLSSDGGTTYAGGGQGHSHTISTTSTNTGSKGSGTAVNNLQPYITCYMWKRTA